MEPENNIEMILDGFCKTDSAEQFIAVGNTSNAFGKKMLAKYANDKRIRFTGAIFDETKINTLRKFCKLYFHGHSVGGTNPSLLEAMACQAVIAAHSNKFNRAVLQSDAFYFNTAHEVAGLINTIKLSENTLSMTNSNLKRIEEEFNWPAIVNKYEEMIVDCYNKSVK
jgi:glycosyltransferase involved in cell wall biosynthesis